MPWPQGARQIKGDPAETRQTSMGLTPPQEQREHMGPNPGFVLESSLSWASGNATAAAARDSNTSAPELTDESRT